MFGACFWAITRRAGVVLISGLALSACVTDQLFVGQNSAPDETALWDWYPDPAEDVAQARRHMTGDGAVKSDDIAFQLLRGAAEREYPEAEFLLGRAYEDGRGTVADPEAAFSWFDRAAGHGHPEAQYRLGIAYYRGEGARLNQGEGVLWLSRAAALGHADAQYQLALAYRSGRGVARNEIEALRLFEAAAEQNHPQAQYVAADAYADGRATERDLTWAARWYGRAADQGVIRAQYKLGLFYLGGLGVPKDRVAAYKWMSLAAEAGLPDAWRMLDQLNKKLSAKQVEQATADAYVWKPSRPPASTGFLADSATVAFAQYSLAQLGYQPGAIDGIYGQNTRDALIAYQNAVGMRADGWITPSLLQRLRADRFAAERALPAS